MTTIYIDDPEEITKTLMALRNYAPAELGDAMKQFADDVMNESALICPVDTGTLRGSRFVNNPHITELAIWLLMGYRTDYGWFVHENLLAHHTPPTQAKFLEMPLMNAASEFLESIVAITMSIIERGG